MGLACSLICDFLLKNEEVEFTYAKIDSREAWNLKKHSFIIYRPILYKK
jgi:hypothetical protein